jgi:hypothetical protein
MPREHMNLVRFAWLYQVHLAIKRPDAREVALIICGFINGASGIAFPKFETIASALHWKPGKSGEGYRRASLAVRSLALDGFLAKSPGNARGAHGRIGPSFALTLPKGMSWQQAVDAYLAVFGVKTDTLDLASSGIGLCGSGTNSTAASSIVRCQSMPGCQSMPVGDGSDPHQQMAVETATERDQHRRAPVHLSTYSQEEGTGARHGVIGSTSRISQMLGAPTFLP